MIKVQFTQAEVDRLKNYTDEFIQYKRGEGCLSGKYDTSKSKYAVVLSGIKGECAVAKYLKQRVNFDLFRGPDNGHDMGFNGVTLQVRSTFHPKGGLVFDSVDQFNSDASILVVDSGWQTAHIVGWVNKGDYRSTYFITNLGYGNRCYLNQDKLNPIETFKASYDYLNRHPGTKAAQL